MIKYTAAKYSHTINDETQILQMPPILLAHSYIAGSGSRRSRALRRKPACPINLGFHWRAHGRRRISRRVQERHRGAHGAAPLTVCYNRPLSSAADFPEDAGGSFVGGMYVSERSAEEH